MNGERPRHIDKTYLSCNKCKKNISKFQETLVIDNEVYCIFCDNWLCGEYDAFGRERRNHAKLFHQRFDIKKEE